MLTITQYDYIRNLYLNKGFSISEIHRKTGFDRTTIKKYIEKENFNESITKKKRISKSDLIRPYVIKILEEDLLKHAKQRHTAKRIFERLQHEHPDKLQIKPRTMRQLVKIEKEKLYKNNDVFLELNHPGGEAQVDFGEVYCYENDILKKYHELVISFPYSNTGYAVLTKSETMEALIEGLIQLFSHINIVPYAIWFDQLAAACVRHKDSEGKLIVTDKFKRFSMHYDFEIKFCNPYSGHEKGSVEKKVGYIRKNFMVPEPKFTNINKFNTKLLNQLDKDHNREHYKKHELISELFEREKKNMRMLNSIEFNSAKYTTAKVNKCGMFRFANNIYSATPAVVGQNVTLSVKANKIIVFDKDMNEIVTHNRLFGKSQKSINWTPFLDIIAKRPRALKYVEFYSSLPENWQNYLETLETKDQKEAISFIKKCILEENIDFAKQILAKNLEKGITDPKALYVTFDRLKENIELYNGNNFKISNFPELPKYEVALDQYDILCQKGGLENARKN